jgi:hypothetical protein
MTASWGADPSATSHAAAQQKERAMNLRTLMQAGPARANELFAKLADTSDGALKTRERLFSELKAELELHCGLEEEHLFPVLRRNAETKGLVADAVKDNRELRAKLAELDALPKTDEAFPERLKELQRLFRQHARDDKKELLPAVQRALSEEKRIVRSSYGGARPQIDFPAMSRAYLDGRLDLDGLVSARIRLDRINEGFAALKRGETIRSVVVFD